MFERLLLCVTELVLLIDEQLNIQLKTETKDVQKYKMHELM